MDEEQIQGPGVESRVPLIPTDAPAYFFPPPSDSAPFSGPLSSKMWSKVNSLKSRLPDRFDYSVFDQLHQKFGESQPRGGVVFKSYLKLIEAEDCKNCFHRFELDTYGRGCTFNCAYCYAKSYLSIRKMWNEPHPFPLDISELRKTFHTVFETDRRHRFRKVMLKRIPLRIGSMSDAFMHLDKKFKVTQEVLKLLRFYRYPYIVFTRSDLIAEEPYMSLFDKSLCSVQMSLSSLNEPLVKQIEPGAPAPLKRLEALRAVANTGVWTTVRINPLFPIYPDGYYSNPNFPNRESIAPFPYFSWDMIKTIAEFDIPSLLIGIVRLYQPNIRFMRKALGYDLRDTYLKGVEYDRASLHFSPAETRFYYEKVKELCTQHGVRFSTCYIGNDTDGSSFFDYQDLWDNKKDCCDAVGNVNAFKATCADLTDTMPNLPKRPYSPAPSPELGL